MELKLKLVTPMRNKYHLRNTCKNLKLKTAKNLVKFIIKTKLSKLSNYEIIFQNQIRHRTRKSPIPQLRCKVNVVVHSQTLKVVQKIATHTDTKATIWSKKPPRKTKPVASKNLDDTVKIQNINFQPVLPPFKLCEVAWRHVDYLILYINCIL